MKTLIRNVTVADGVDGVYPANVLLQDEIILRVDRGTGEKLQGDLEIDGTGLTLMPGFVDIHRHADLKPFTGERWFELNQGITSMVSGNCGFSAFPGPGEYFDAARKYALPILGETPAALAGLTPEEFFTSVAAQKLRNNVGYLVGNGSLRRCVCGFSDRRPDRKERQRILDLLDRSLEAGALGLSYGIMYTPECFDTTEELTAMAAVAASRGKPFTAHIRGEGGSVVASIDEMIEVGRRSGARVHISHMKAAGTDMWGWAVDEILDHIRRGREEGIDISFDAYPYTAGSTSLLSLLPPEFLAGGTDGVLAAIRDPEKRKEILKAFGKKRADWDNYILTLGWQRVIVSDSSDPAEIGRDIRTLAEEKHADPGAFALDLLDREDGCVPIVLEEMDPEDVRKILREPGCILISDSLYSAAGKPHPRKYGAFQRFIRQFVLEERVMSLQEAVSKMTCLPAAFLNLKNRGRILEGWYADLVLADMTRWRDLATYTDPVRDGSGIEKVFVNGKIAFDAGSPETACAGVLLKG